VSFRISIKYIGSSLTIEDALTSLLRDTSVIIAKALKISIGTVFVAHFV
jgi:hypothetical protein